MTTYGQNLDSTITETWWAAHLAYKRGDVETAFTLYRGLRRDHGVELFYEVEPILPVRFIHPIGAVLGRATYAPNLVVYQCSGVGSDLDGNRPTFLGPCVLFPGARVLGKSIIGKNVFIQANTVVMNQKIPDDSVVFGDRAVLMIKPTKRSVVEAFFK